MGALDFSAGFRGIVLHPWTQHLFKFSTDIWESPVFRLFSLIVFVLATIWIIAKVYSGDLQNAEKGPVSIRKHSAGSVSESTVIVNRNLIPMTMDGVHARCVFYYVYEDKNKKRRRIRLCAKDIRISVSPSVLRSLSDMTKGTEVLDTGSTEVIWPVLEVDTESPDRIDATPEKAADYLLQNKVLERWPGDDSLSLISLHQDVIDDVKEARGDFVLKRVRKLRSAKAAKWFRKARIRYWSNRRPGAIGNYYLKFQFSNDPFFVLTKHPDRDVRMTAWLTVLTSVFAIVMELFPLNVREKEAIRTASPRAEQHVSTGQTNAKATLTSQSVEN